MYSTLQKRRILFALFLLPYTCMPSEANLSCGSTFRTICVAGMLLFYGTNRNHKVEGADFQMTTVRDAIGYDVTIMDNNEIGIGGIKGDEQPLIVVFDQDLNIKRNISFDILPDTTVGTAEKTIIRSLAYENVKNTFGMAGGQSTLEAFFIGRIGGDGRVANWATYFYLLCLPDIPSPVCPPEPSYVLHTIKPILTNSHTNTRTLLGYLITGNLELKEPTLSSSKIVSYGLMGRFNILSQINRIVRVSGYANTTIPINPAPELLLRSRQTCTRVFGR